MMIFKKICFLLCLSLIFSQVSANAQNGFPKLEKQIKAKNYKEAYQIALILLDQNEGNPRFDYLYGFSALQTGHYNEAIFALNRVTVSTPRVIRPRLELARAYLKLNNKIAAVKEFNNVLFLSPPPNVSKNVSAYLSELNRSGKLIKKSIIKRLASFSIGFDDNINFGTDNSEIELPGFGLVTLNSSAIKQKSGFAEAKFQLLQKNNKSQARSSFLLANFSHKKYFKKTKFDYSDIDLRAGFSMAHQSKKYQFVLRDRPVFLNGKLYRNTFGIDAILRNKLAAGKVFNFYLSSEKYNNKKDKLTNRKRVVLGAKIDQVSGKNQYQFNVQIGKEFADRKAGKQFSRNFIGVGYKISHEWNAKNNSFLNLDYRNYKHQAAYPIFPKKREDNRFTVNAIHELVLSKKTSLILSLRHENNKSNLDLYDAKRNEIKIGVHYEWD